MRAALFLVLVSCVDPHVTECDGYVCPGTQVCDPNREGCVFPSQLTTCDATAPDGTPCVVSNPNDGVCIGHVCEIATCGDGFITAPEQCDGTVLGPDSSCSLHDFYYDVPARCGDDCAFDYAQCTGTCGDGHVDEGFELCDATELALSCVDLGFAAGYLACGTHTCGPVFDDCHGLGWKSRPFQGQINSVHGSSENDVYVAGATIQHYNGSTWSTIDTSPCSPTQPTFQSVWSFGNGEALAIGAAGIDPGMGIAMRITNSTCAVVDVGAGNRALRGIWAAGKNDIWIAGDGIRHFDGTAWTVSLPLDQGELYALWGTSSSDLYAGGESGLRHFDGTSWSVTSFATDLALSGPFTINGIVGTSATDVYATIAQGANNGLYHWSGSRWSKVLSGPAGSTDSLGLAGSRVFVGTPVGLFVLAGTSWLHLHPPIGASPASGPMFGLPNGRLFASAATGLIFDYPGAEVSTRAFAGFGARVIAASPTSAFALTYTNVVPAQSGDFYRYDGDGWTQPDLVHAPNTLGEIVDLWRSPTSGDIYLENGNNGHGALYVFRIATSTFDPDALVGLPPNTTMWGTSDSDMWFVTMYGTQLQHFNGTSLGGIAYSTMGTANLSQIWGSAEDSYYAVGSGGTVVHWNGSTWSDVAVPTTADLASIIGFGRDDLVILGTDTMLRYDGTTWTASPGPPGTPFAHSLAGTSPTDLYGTTANGLFHYDGVHWSPVQSGTTGAINAIDVAGDVAIYLDELGDVRTLLRTVVW